MGTDLTAEQRERLTQSVCAGRKIEAIKDLRDWTSLGLKEAKDIVDRMESDLRAANPERFARSPGPSVAVRIIAVLIFVIVTTLVVYFLFH